MHMSKHSKYFYLIVYALVCLPLASFYLSGIYFLLVPITVFIVIPIIDFFFRDAINPGSEETMNRKHDLFYQRILLLYLPTHVALIVGGMVYLFVMPISFIELVLLSFMIGIITGSVGINIAHELMHKANLLNQVVSRIILTFVCYGHFVIEHVRGHHVNVATPNDPATARLNESIYRFLPRTVIGSWKSAWKIEGNRLNRQGKSFYHWDNEFYWVITGPLILICMAYSIVGALGVIFFLLQSIVAILMLEVVNYIEHYGLVRNKLANGQYEVVGERHAWDADHWLSNHILFNLMRHADHHIYGFKPYQILLISRQSPKLPASYATLYWLVFIPPLWFTIMNPILDAHQRTEQQVHIAS